MLQAAMFDTKPYDTASFDRNQHPDLSIASFPARLDETTVSLAQGFDAVIAFVNDDLNRAVIERLSAMGVRLIALRCSGFNNVDVRAAFQKIHIVRVPAYSPEAVAEHAMALLTTSVRRIHKAYNRTRDFNFSIAGLEGVNLHGRTVGVIGTGKIGKAFLNICAGYGMRALAYDPTPTPDARAEYVSLDELFRRSDVISLHCPLTAENHHLICADTLACMKDGVIVVNTSRGSLIDAEALLDAIKSKKVGAACLDVYEEETDLFFEDKSGHILQDDVLARLLSMPNVLLTAHQAFLTHEALDSIARTTIANILAFFHNEPLPNEICYRCARMDACKAERRERCF